MRRLHADSLARIPGFGVDRNPQHVQAVACDTIAQPDQPVFIVERDYGNVLMDEQLDRVEVAIALRLTLRTRLIVKERFETLGAVE